MSDTHTTRGKEDIFKVGQLLGISEQAIEDTDDNINSVQLSRSTVGYIFAMAFHTVGTDTATLRKVYRQCRTNAVDRMVDLAVAKHTASPVLHPIKFRGPEYKPVTEQEFRQFEAELFDGHCVDTAESWASLGCYAYFHGFSHKVLVTACAMAERFFDVADQDCTFKQTDETANWGGMDGTFVHDYTRAIQKMEAAVCHIIRA